MVLQKPETKLEKLVTPCASPDIIYRAFSRPYDEGEGQVINLLASCSFSTSNWSISFAGDGDGKYILYQHQPSLFFHMLTYYTASYTTGIGLGDPVDHVIIVDAFGEHYVAVEKMK